MSRTLRRSLLLVLLGYIAVATFFYLNQRSFIYHPDSRRIAPAAAGLRDFQAVEIATADGVRIVGWWKPPRPGHGAVLYLHGNGGNLAVRASRFRALSRAGLGVLAIDWRGYGGSGGAPSEAGLMADARAAHDWLSARIPPAKIALFGESLGTAVAVKLAAERRVAGVVLDSPYSSMTRVVQSHVPWLPVWLMLRDRYEADEAIARIRAPLLIAHCQGDRTIPTREARRLFAAAAQPKRYRELPGCGHAMTWPGAGREMVRALAVWTGSPTAGLPIVIAPARER